MNRIVSHTRPDPAASDEPTLRHTRGAWRRGIGNIIWRTWIDAEGRRVHTPIAETCLLPDMADGEWDANGALLAAAPDLLAALEKARVAIATWSPTPDEPLAEIDAALAKATVGSPTKPTPPGV